MHKTIISLLLSVLLLSNTNLIAQRIIVQELAPVEQITRVQQVTLVKSLFNHLEYNPTNMEEVIRRHTDSLLHSYSLYSINATTLQDIWHKVPTELSLSIPIKFGEDEMVDMELRPIFSNGLNVVNQHQQRLETTPFLCYQGKVRGKSRSLVAISFTQSGVAGVISFGEGNYVLSKIQGSEYDVYCVYNDKDFKTPMNFMCGNTGNDTLTSPEQTHGSKKKKGNALQTGQCQVLKVDIDCEFEMLQHFGNIARTTDFVVNIFNVVSTIYRAENINIFIEKLVIWQNNDPFNIAFDDPNDEEQGQTLQQYIDERQVYSGNFAYLFRKIPWADFNGAKGKAEEIGDDLCDDDDAYAYSWVLGEGQLTPSLYSRDAWVFAHELGHVLGSRHTHWCGWLGGAIDNCNKLMADPRSNEPYYTWFPPAIYWCSDGPTPPANGGTIMSYCANTSVVTVDFANGFGWQPGNAIRSHVNANSGCTSEFESMIINRCVQNYTISGWNWNHDNHFLYVANHILAGTNPPTCGGTQGPVTINNTSEPIHWFAGKSIRLTPGFRKTNTGVFHARIYPWLNCNNATANISRDPYDKPIEVQSYQPIQDIEIQPNPAQTCITIAGYFEQDAFVYSSLGNMVISISNKERTADISQLTQGTYYIRCTTPQGVVVKPFVIVR